MTCSADENKLGKGANNHYSPRDCWDSILNQREG